MHAQQNMLQHKINPKYQSQVYSPPITSDLDMDRAYSGFSASKICYLLSYLDTHLLTAPGLTRGPEQVEVDDQVELVEPCLTGKQPLQQR